ncbi:MAG TPA: hypothetical protein DIT07_04370 [Sphingobacteriaceae bacterium]|nr:hypothetical protein [Sphingobacteriaceae bacterium]
MVQRLLVFISIFCFSFTYAQDRKAVSDSIDLNALKQYPTKDSLPVNKPVLAIQPVHIPVSELNLKVNYWKNWITFGLNLNQASFSNNWSAGAVNSVALGSQFNYKTDYTKGDKNYVSEVILQYGKLKNKGQYERKTSDRIYWDNKAGLKLSTNWYFFGSLNFESQFDDGFTFGKDAQGNETRSIISRFMAPGYLTESIGFEYKPVKYFWVRIGTGTARQTFVSDTALYKTNPKNFGVKPGRSFRNELAFQFVTNFDKDIAKNLNLKSHYTMFANYEKFNNIDHRFDLTLAARVNRLVNVSISGIVLYDDDASTNIQASQTIGFGLMYKLP